MEELIEKVREHEVIYNTISRDYRNQHVRQNAWEKIASELNISANEAKDRWDKLRRCFCNARNRRRADRKTGTPAKKISFWKYEQQLDFLTPFLESRKAHTNENSQSSPIETELTIPKEELQSDTDETSIPNVQVIQVSQVKEQVNLDASVETGSCENEGEEEPLLGVEKDRKTYQKRTQKRINDTPVCQSVDLKKLRCEEEKISLGPLFKETSPLFNALDDMDMFFLSMSRMTKQLPKLDQAQIKLQLSNAVLSAEIKNQQQLV